MKTRTAHAAPNRKATAEIARIAARHLHIDTLDERGVDRLDCHDLGVVSIREALEAAYAAGAASVAGKAVRA